MGSSGDVPPGQSSPSPFHQHDPIATRLDPSDSCLRFLPVFFYVHSNSSNPKRRSRSSEISSLASSSSRPVSSPSHERDLPLPQSATRSACPSLDERDSFAPSVISSLTRSSIGTRRLGKVCCRPRSSPPSSFYVHTRDFISSLLILTSPPFKLLPSFFPRSLQPHLLPRRPFRRRDPLRHRPLRRMHPLLRIRPRHQPPLLPLVVHPRLRLRQVRRLEERRPMLPQSRLCRGGRRRGVEQPRFLLPPHGRYRGS